LLKKDFQEEDGKGDLRRPLSALATMAMALSTGMANAQSSITLDRIRHNFQPILIPRLSAARSTGLAMPPSNTVSGPQ
jgi:hypothetical protein